MSTLRRALEDYLALRRSVGVGLQDTERILGHFVTFAEQEQTERITVDLARRWACEPQGTYPAWWARRLGMVRGFAQYLSAQEPTTEIPPKGLLPHRYPRATPYLYTDEDIAQLYQATRELPSASGMGPWSYATLFALLAVTGMRIGEALHPEREDVELTRGILHLRRTKLSKQRLVPLHPSTRDALLEYQSHRDRIYPRPSTSAFFLAEQGGALRDGAVRKIFTKVSLQIGLRDPSQGRAPRLHDLRHRFAVRTLIGWYRSGLDVEAQLPKLTTYLGHSHVHATYWYLTAVPELMQGAVARLDEEEQAS